MKGKLTTLITLLISTAVLADLGEAPNPNTDGTIRKSSGAPQQEVLPQVEQVGRILSTGFGSRKVSKEASKQKAKCSGCERKRKFTIDVKIKVATSANFNGTSYDLLEFKEGSEQHQLFEKLHTSSPQARKAVFKEIKRKIGCGEGMIDFYVQSRK